MSKALNPVASKFVIPNFLQTGFKKLKKKIAIEIIKYNLRGKKLKKEKTLTTSSIITEAHKLHLSNHPEKKAERLGTC